MSWHHIWHILLGWAILDARVSYHCYSAFLKIKVYINHNFLLIFFSDAAQLAQMIPNATSQTTTTADLTLNAVQMSNVKLTTTWSSIVAKTSIEDVGILRTWPLFTCALRLVGIRLVKESCMPLRGLRDRETDKEQYI